MTREPDVELVYFSGCPHVESARTNLQVALRRAGITPEWTEWDLEDPSTPRRVSGHGSPTVLVEGRDVTGRVPETEVGVLACRTDGAPTRSQIEAALVKWNGKEARTR